MVRANVAIVKFKISVWQEHSEGPTEHVGACRSALHYALATPGLLRHLSHNALHTRTLGSPLRLFSGERHDAPELFTLLRDQPRHNCSQVIVAQLRRLQVTLQDFRLALLSFYQV